MKNTNTKTCTIENCENKIVARGWCNKHYQRWYKHGDPLIKRTFDTPEESFAARTEWRGACLIWTGSKDLKGYGQIRADSKTAFAHRYAYERKYGPIPEGMTVDHTCYNRACVNFFHLRLATHTQNNSNLAGRTASKQSPGPRNVYPVGKRWQVLVTKDGVQHYFGGFGSIEEASVVAEQARHELFGEFAGKG